LFFLVRFTVRGKLVNIRDRLRIPEKEAVKNQEKKNRPAPEVSFHSAILFTTVLVFGLVLQPFGKSENIFSRQVSTGFGHQIYEKQKFTGMTKKIGGIPKTVNRHMEFCTDNAHDQKSRLENEPSRCRPKQRMCLRRILLFYLIFKRK
jgi:hypothetical protein